MKFGGPAFLIDRSDINTDEIIPAKYLTEITKLALKPHLLEDLHLFDTFFDPDSAELHAATVLVTRSNFGCGSSREHAVWALEVNNINVVIAESFARIFRQNMFNCGMLAIELPKADIDAMIAMRQEFGDLNVQIDLQEQKVTACGGNRQESFSFELSQFDKALVDAGGWVEYADARY